MNDQQDPPEQKATEQPQQTEAAVPEPEPVAAPEAAEPEPTPEAIEAEIEAPLAEEETEQPEEAFWDYSEAELAPAEQRCPVRMYGPRCGRPIYAAPTGVDKRPVCLMHSKDLDKSHEGFQKEFERILAAGDVVADFTRFVFPSVRCPDRKFVARCIFSGATFTQVADFSWATFAQTAYFSGATFTQNAILRGATFTQAAYFSGATFTRAAYFIWATFTQRAFFREATFTGGADFRLATFTQAADFSWATLTKEADFSGATFAGAADFSHAVFTGTAHFAPLEAKPCKFKDSVLFQDARFQDYADFRGVVFGEPGNSTVRAVFSLARFERPERVTFYKTWLGQTLFVNCDLSKLSFSDVEWGRDGERIRLYEETVALDDETAEALKAPVGSRDERNYRLIAETYHQLKNNYDSRGDPWTAGEFHYGEMEMLRRSSRWPRVGLTALYKYASQYGLSMAWPLRWLAGVLLLFTLLYPLAGLRPVTARTQATLPVAQVKPITYWNLPEATGWFPRPVRLVGHSFMTTLAVASLQREAAYYEPAYGPGRFLGILELALTSTLAALFILAVRRQFKRGGD
jgi:uncharacterized protein YjbI with pentapeptide repeats